jgi:hypothetical protein
MIGRGLVIAVRTSSATVSTTATATVAATTATITATTAATTAVATTTASTARTVVVLGAGFVAGNSTTGNFLLIQAIDSRFGFICVWHFDESESSRTTGFPIRYDTYLRDLAKPTESLTYLVFRGSE